MKTCSRCKRDLPLDRFHCQRSKRDGLCSHCKDCEAKRCATDARRAAGRERQRRAREKPEVKDRERQYIKANREKINAYRRSWEARNNEHVRAWHRRWRRNNLDKDAAKSARRRFRCNGGRVTAAQWAEILASFGGRCLACGTTEHIEMDHVIPLVRGGRHDVSNVQPLCSTCNKSKRDKVIDYRTAATA